MYYLYKFTNLINGKIYYGMTNDVKQRVATHKSMAKTKITSNPFHNAIRKYGFENFTLEVIAEFSSRDECCVAEINVISLAKEIGEDILYQILLVRKEKEKIYEALKHYLISGRVHAFIDEKDGHPYRHDER